MESAHTLSRRDGVIAYWRWRAPGQRRAIVLLHGLASNHTRWSEFIQNTTLKANWDLLSVDLRGHGRSEPRGRINMSVWCDDLIAILRQEGLGQAVILGHCLGANLGLHFARRYPDACGGLILIEPMFPQALLGRLRRIMVVEPWVRFGIAVVRLVNTLGIRRRHFPQLDLRQLDEQTRATISASGSEDSLLKRYASPWHDLQIMPLASFLQSLLEIKRPLPALDRVRVPVLALLSSGSRFSEPQRTRALLETLPRCRIVDLPAHHWIPTEQPEGMRHAIEDWCADLGAH